MKAKTKARGDEGMINGTYVLYKLAPDGSLTRIDKIAYTAPGERVPGFDKCLREYLHYDTSAVLDDMALCDELEEESGRLTFEALADAASEGAGGTVFDS